MRRVLTVSLLLVIIVFGIYAQVVDHAFLTLDDLSYVKSNEHVNRGLSLDAVRWAMTSEVVSNWHPLTMLSHQLDVTLFGVGDGAAGKHLLVNVALHALNGVLLLTLLRAMTGRLWLSAAVAFVWAVHPLRVESVAWVAERKDVLCALFWLLAMHAYVRYARAQRGRQARWYAAALALFILGYLSKPMIVTLPFVLLLIDIWPLDRLRIGGQPRRDDTSPIGPDTPGVGLRRAILEKLPFFVLAVVFSIVTFLVQQQSKAMTWAAEIPLADRALNAIVVYVIYLRQTIWPSGLAVLYPHRSLVGLGAWPVGIVAGCGAILLAVTAACAAMWRAGVSTSRGRAPMIGWLWFLGTLVPVIGLVQVGFHGHADRYTYLPAIGLIIAMVWAVDAVTARWRRRAVPLACLAVAVIAALAGASFMQVRHWTDSIALFERSVAITDRNWFALGLLGSAYRDADRLDASIAAYEAATAIREDNAELYNDFAQSLLLDERFDEAAAAIDRAMALDSESYRSHNNRGLLLAARGRSAEALRAYAEALKRKPEAVDVLLNIAQVHFTDGDYPRAIDAYTRALALEPAPAPVHNNLGFAYQRTGQLSRAIEQYERALSLDPSFGKAHYNLAQVHAQLGRDEQAVAAYRRAIAQDATVADWHYNLAISLARLGRYDQALAAMEKVLELTPADAEARQQANRLRRLAGEGG